MSNKLTNDQLFDILDEIESGKPDEEILKIINTKPDPKNINHNVCPTCGTDIHIVTDFSYGINVCSSCGIVINNILDDNREWKQYNEDKENNIRNSMNYFLPQSSLGTTIACSNRLALKRLHNWSSMPYKERSLNNVLKDIQSRCRTNNLMKYIEDDAKILYKNISESKHPDGKNKGKNIIIRGSNRKSLIAACVFFACKRNGNTRSPHEIAKIFDLNHKEITKGCKIFLNLMRIREMTYATQTSTAEHFIIRYCRELKISKNIIPQALQISKNIQKLNIASAHTPFSVAIGSIMAIINLNNLNITKKIIVEKFDVTEVTITKAYKKIEKYIQILISDDLVDKLVNIIDQEKKDSPIPKKLTNLYNSISENYNIQDINNKYFDILKDSEIKYNQIKSEILKIINKNQNLVDYIK